MRMALCCLVLGGDPKTHSWARMLAENSEFFSDDPLDPSCVRSHSPWSSDRIHLWGTSIPFLQTSDHAFLFEDSDRRFNRNVSGL
jgi:hypothetical protein